MRIEPVTPEELREALPRFRKEAVQKQVAQEPPPLPDSLRLRCGLVDYILSGNGSSEDRLFEVLAKLPLDV